MNDSDAIEIDWASSDPNLRGPYHAPAGSRSTPFAIAGGAAPGLRFAQVRSGAAYPEFLAPLDVTIVSQRRTRPPYGLEGGRAGSCGRNLLIRGNDNVIGPPPRPSVRDGAPPTGAPDASRIDLESMCRLHVNPGDRLIIETPGGGGFGRPVDSR